MVSLVCICATVANGNASELSGAAYVVCDGASHSVTVSGMYYMGVDGEYTSIVLERRAVGVCAPPELLMDYAQPFVPEPSAGFYADYLCTFVIPAPALQIVYRYAPYGVKADNSLQAIFTFCDTDFRGHAQVDCVDAPFTRGTVALGYDWTLGMSIQIVACTQDCWCTDLGFEISGEVFEQYAGEPALGLVGQVVDVYGGRTYCGMIGDPRYYIRKIERAPLGICGPVPARVTNWGSVKALYR